MAVEVQDLAVELVLDGLRRLCRIFGALAAVEELPVEDRTTTYSPVVVLSLEVAAVVLVIPCH